MWNSLYGAAPLIATVNRYPDKRLLEAAQLLPDIERPTVPVRMFTDPGEFYKRSEHMTKELRKNPPLGLVEPDRKYIRVNGKVRYNRDPKALAAVIAHEQRHITGGDETEASLKEAEVLARLAQSKYRDRIRLLRIPAGSGK